MMTLRHPSLRRFNDQPELEVYCMKIKEARVLEDKEETRYNYSEVYK